MTTTVRKAIFIGVAALVVGSAVGPRWVYAQTPAQMEAERQAREYRQSQERAREEQQRLQQLMNDNARRAQEESARAARESSRAIREWSPSTPGSSPSGSGAGAARPAASDDCTARSVRGGAPAAGLLIRVGVVTQSGALNPLVKQGFFLLQDSADDALTKGGFRPPPGMSPRTGLEHARINNTPNLQQAVAALLANNVCGPVYTDLNGMAHFPALNPGTYYLYGGNLKPRLAWNLRVDLKPGANSVTLDQRNASPFN